MHHILRNVSSPTKRKKIIVKQHKSVFSQNLERGLSHPLFTLISTWEAIRGAYDNSLRYSFIKKLRTYDLGPPSNRKMIIQKSLVTGPIFFKQ